MSESKTKLKPCPFCGGEAYIRKGEEIAAAQCSAAQNHRLVVDGDNNAANEVAELWNQRANETTMLAALREARDWLRNEAQLLTKPGDFYRKVNEIDIAIQAATGGSE